MPLVATIVRDAGYDVQQYVEHIGPIQWDRVMEADVVCFHAFSSTMPKTIDYIKKGQGRPPGHAYNYGRNPCIGDGRGHASVLRLGGP